MKRKLLKQLIEWKNKPNRMPLVINGARQVGKTFILKEFGQAEYNDVVYVNFESNISASKLFEDNLDPKTLIKNLELISQKKINAHNTLIIFDEIQSCPRALTSLKYFCENASEYHIVAAGSLLGVAINREKYSFPVGKVETQILHPMDFEEFLIATGNTEIDLLIKTSFNSNIPIPQVLHEKCLALYRKYLVVGGMPQSVKSFIETEQLMDVAEIQSRILNDYISDMAKYATAIESVKIRAAYNSLPSQLAKENKKFQYKVIQKGASATLFGAAIDWLEFAGVVNKCQKIEQGNSPINVYADMSSFKLYMSDVGMLLMRSGLPIQTIFAHQDVSNTFLGAVAENFVAQSLVSSGHNIFYWESKSIAEVDFVIQKGEDVIPIEVKAGTHTKSKSLSEFVKKYSPRYSIRISAKNFGFENNIKSVPLYAAYLI